MTCQQQIASSHHCYSFIFRSTILRILSGRHLTKPDNAVQVLGRSAFHDTRLNFERSYLDTDWGMRTVAFAGYGCPLQVQQQPRITCLPSSATV